MTEVVKHITIELREGTAAEWAASGRILRAGEAGVEIDTMKLKIGNGVAGWAALPYFLNETQVAVLIEAAIGDAELVGVPGDSAYDVAVDNGFVGTEEEWLESLVGPAGSDGTDGTNGTNGTNGSNGTDGADGEDGADGAPGISAYQVAVNNGFVGNEAAWLASLHGTNGTNGTNGSAGADGDDGADGESVTVTLVDFEDWPPASDSNPLHLYFRLPEA